MELRLKIPGKIHVSFKPVCFGAGKMILCEKALTGKCKDLQSPHSGQRKPTSRKLSSDLQTCTDTESHMHTQ